MTSAIETLDFSAKTDPEIQTLLKEYNIVLTPSEARTIQDTILNRPPTLAECILWSIEGSEHCSYKSSRQHLKELPTQGPDVILGAKEDAGIISIAQDNQGHHYGLVISHESHNHPSQIVPFEGAATGVGGNVRDVCCMGATVIGLADSLRFGDIQENKSRWIHEGVISGIASYGNSLGIPNLAGDVFYDNAYNDNCLVTVVTIGIVKENEIIHSYAPKNANGYDLILVGKPTDMSGFGGASFASLELSGDEKEQNRGAVQEPNAFLERHLLKASYALFQILKQKELLDKVGFKDLGAGGIACASVELAESGGYGAEVELEKIPVGMENIHPSVILCSETQERFMWVAHPDVTPLILDHYNKTYDLPNVSTGSQAAVIGKICDHGDYIVRYHGETIVHAKASDVTEGLVYSREFQTPEKQFKEPTIPTPNDFNETLLAILRHESIASREPIYENYDKQVQGRTLIERDQASAGVVTPFNSSDYPEEIRKTGIALSVSQNPRYNKIDPYWGAVNAIVNAMRKVASVGASPITLTDCLCFGNPEKPEQMWEFVEAIRGIKETCHSISPKNHLGTPMPVIAGNVSFYNESKQGAIPPSPMISCVGKLKEASKAITPDFKQIDSLIYIIGERQDECGGSVYYALHDQLGAHCPKPNLKQTADEIHLLVEAIENNLVLAATPIAEGGLATAIAKMTLASSIGCDVTISSQLPFEKILFSETGGFILEVNPAQKNHLKQLFSTHKIHFEQIGKTNKEPIIKINEHIHCPIHTAKKAWETGLREKLW